MSVDALIAVGLAVLGLLLAYAMPKVGRKQSAGRSMQRCAQDAEMAKVKHGR